MLVRTDMPLTAEMDWLDQAIAERAPYRMTLALDPGVVSGWARSDGTSGVLDLSKYDDHGEAVWQWAQWLQTVLGGVTHLATEQSIFLSRMAHAELVTTLGLTAHALAWQRGIPRERHTASKVRKAVTGRGIINRKALGLSKAAAGRVMDNDILTAVTALGFKPETPHAADAAALLCYAEGRHA